MKKEITIQGLYSSLQPAKQQRKTIGFVPTMGNLHAGHIKLVEQARRVCDIVVVSIFVNPTQFGINEDFDLYPRTLEADSALLEAAGCDIVFAPTIEQMYPEGNTSQTTVQVNPIASLLCGQNRPGHFTGVATVVTKLFNIVYPSMAFFGEKDYQQLAIIKQLVKDLCIPVEIISVPTQRAEDGLALSSRNSFLSPEQREIAPKIYQILQELSTKLQDGELEFNELEEAATQKLNHAGFQVDYVSIMQPNLTPPLTDGTNFVILVAARLGQTRLIDNMTVQLA